MRWPISPFKSNQQCSSSSHDQGNSSTLMDFMSGDLPDTPWIVLEAGHNCVASGIHGRGSIGHRQMVGLGMCLQRCYPDISIGQLSANGRCLFFGACLRHLEEVDARFQAVDLQSGCRIIFSGLALFTDKLVEELHVPTIGTLEELAYVEEADWCGILEASSSLQ